MFFGNVFNKNIDYVRVFSGISMRAVRKGRLIKKVAVASDSKVSVLYKFVSVDNLTEVVIMGADGTIKNTLPVDKVFCLVERAKPYLSVEAEARRLDIIR